MTTQIGEHGLFCVSDSDYAAIALAMQCNAETTDTALTATNTSLNSWLGRPWISAANTIALSIDDTTGGGAPGPEGVIGEALAPSALNSITNGIETPEFLMISGVYLIGASINWTFGATTANSFRELSVYGVKFENGSSSTITNYTDLYSIRDYQGEAGASGALNVVGFLDNTAGNMDRVEAFFSHANTASNAAVAISNFRVWAHYLGSGLVI